MIGRFVPGKIRPSAFSQIPWPEIRRPGQPGGKRDMHVAGARCRSRTKTYRIFASSNAAST
ncbi:hypothetical protein WS97_02000 [Burkholderia territorii]|nr:hypothetical protein WS97_02000 [Burkholderia territorii]